MEILLIKKMIYGGGHILWVLNREIYVKDSFFFTTSLTGSYLIIDSLQKPARSFNEYKKKVLGGINGRMSPLL